MKISKFLKILKIAFDTGKLYVLGNPKISGIKFYIEHKTLIKISFLLTKFQLKFLFPSLILEHKEFI